MSEKPPIAKLGRSLDRAHRFAWLVVLCGSCSTALMAFHGEFADAGRLSPGLVGLGAMLLLSEFIPLKLPRRSNDTAFGASTLFAVALLALYGTGTATLWFTAAVVLHDVFRRKPAIKVAFNAAQFALALAASGQWLSLLSDLPSASPLTPYSIWTASRRSTTRSGTAPET